MAAEILAVQVRKPGFAWRSTPAQAMWLLACQNAIYRVHLVPEMPTRVERVE